LKVIVDASNVACFGIKDESKAKLKYILSAVSALEERGDDFEIHLDIKKKNKDKE
jgi:hypothetical protein